MNNYYKANAQCMILSGKNVAKLGLIGFFPACYLGVTAMTVATAGTVLAAGFVGGMALYFARNVIANFLSTCIKMNTRTSQAFLRLLDMGSVMFAATAGAWLLGLAVYPVVVCVALGLATLGLVNFILAPSNTLENIFTYKVNYMALDEALVRPLSFEVG